MTTSDKNILYVASAVDMASKQRLGTSKIGIATSDADKRIKNLNSTKMPIKVELVAAWTFEDSPFSAADAEKAAHSLLEPYNVNGEWFQDDADDLADRVAKFVERLGAKPVGDETAELAEMNEKQREAQLRNKEFFEPLSAELEAMGFELRYMQWRVGITTNLGRIIISVTKGGELYIYLFLNQPLEIEEVRGLSPIHWRERSVEGRLLANKVAQEELLTFLRASLSYRAPDVTIDPE